MLRTLSNIHPVVWIGFALLSLALLLGLWTRGMFLDGTTYAAIARNLAIGQGTFWSPHYTETLYPQFFEHPPLGLWLESLPFRLFGDHWWVERLYGLVLYVCTIGISYKITQSKLIIPLMALSPLCLWTSRNVMLELSLCLACLLCIYTTYQALKAERKLVVCVSYSLVAGLLLVVAIHIKGPVALFPLASPLILVSLGETTWRRALVCLLAILVILAGTAAFIYQSPEALMNWGAYWDQQVSASITGQRELSARGEFVLRAAIEMGIPLLILYILGRKVKLQPGISQRSKSLALISLSATLPLLVSPKLHAHYLYPGLIIWLIFLAERYDDLLEHISWSLSRKRVVAIISALVIITTLIIGFSRYGHVIRDEEIILKVDNLATRHEAGTILCIDANDYANWKYHAYAQRIGRLSLRVGGDCTEQ